MPFAIEVTHLEAPTEIYDKLGEYVPKEHPKSTEVFVVVATYRNVINWFILGNMNYDAQSFRDEIYTCAALAHNTLERGCGKYYRGTNAVHVKRQHADAFEAVYNHNHYPLGGPQGANVDPTAFPDPVSPEEFKQHMLAFATEDAKMHGGTPRFLTTLKALKIAAAFEANCLLEKEQNLPPDPQAREYDSDDREELRVFGIQEQPCKSESSSGTPVIRGIDANKADQRQPKEYSHNSYQSVVLFRKIGQAMQAQTDRLAQELQLKLAQESAAFNEAISNVCESLLPSSSAAIASAEFQKEAVATAIEISMQSIAQLSLDYSDPNMQAVQQSAQSDAEKPKNIR